MGETITREQARRFYDAFGAKQDQQGFYEDAALERLISLGRVEDAGSVLELGCGTGRFAARLLGEHLSPSARYLGIDLSATMVGLAARRLERFGARCEVRLSDGSLDLSEIGGRHDRIISCYVLDLLSHSDISTWLKTSRHALSPGGLVCHTGLTRGTGLLSKTTSSVWSLVHRIRPLRVGGCRPLSIVDHLDEADWRTIRREVVVSAGIASEVVVLEAR